MTRLLVLEMGPLLTALLLCGRIGGSYAGRGATLGATRQDALLESLGLSGVAWTLGPSLMAAGLAAPMLTVVGTAVALGCAAWMGTFHGLLPISEFYRKAVETSFPILRLKITESLVQLYESVVTAQAGNTCVASAVEDVAELSEGEDNVATCIEPETLGWKDIVWDLRPTFSDSYWDALVEVLTHPVMFHLFKALVLSFGSVLIADQCARRPLTPRLVPLAITAAVEQWSRGWSKQKLIGDFPNFGFKGTRHPWNGIFSLLKF